MDQPAICRQRTFGKYSSKAACDQQCHHHADDAVEQTTAQTSSSAADGGQLVLVGPAGCDVSDASCTPPSHAAMQQVSILRWESPAGAMSEAAPALDTGGIPVWLHTDGRCLFAALANSSQIVSYERSAPQVDAATATDGGDGDGGAAVELTLRSRVASGGKNPVYVDSRRGVLVAANYHGPDDTTAPDGAGVASFVVGADCGLTAAGWLPVHGSSTVPSRQGAAHVHSTVFDDVAPPGARGRHRLYACDLGSDAIYTIDVDGADGSLTQVQRTATTPGSGPRHLVVHPTLRVAFVVHEMGNYVAAYAIGADGRLVETQHVRTLPEEAHHHSPEGGEGGKEGFSKAAELLVAPDGTSVFASNRGYGTDATNSIAAFSVAANGSLELVDVIASGVRYPRGMELAPDGRTLVVAGQSSGDVVTFAAEGSGRLRKIRQAATGLATPSTIAFFPA